MKETTIALLIIILIIEIKYGAINFKIMWTPEQEKAAEKLLARLRQQPLAKEREEFGMMLMRHIDSFTPEERKRYEELKAILREG